MKLKPVLLWGLIFLGGLGLGLAAQSLFFAPDKTPAKKASNTGLEGSAFSGANISAKDVQLEQGKDGILQWKLLAKGVRYNQAKNTVQVNGPQLTAYFGKDRKEVYVRATRGDVDQKNDNVTLYDKVIGKFGEFSLTASNFDYIGAIEKIFMKGGVSVTRPDLSVNATAVEIDIRARQLVAAGRVIAVITTSDDITKPLTGSGKE